MKIAVTGGRGWVGRYAVQELVKHGYDLRLLVRTPWESYPEGAEVIEHLDLTNFDHVKLALDGCDRVLHLANIPGPLNEERPETFDNNMIVNYHVVLAAGLLGIDRVVVVSSVCANGFCRRRNFPAPRYFPLDEEHPCFVDNTYGISKHLSEMMCQRMIQRFPFMTIPLMRIGYTAPPDRYGEGPEPDTINSFLSAFGSYIDGRDAATAFRRALEADISGAPIYYIVDRVNMCRLPTKRFLDAFYPDVPLKRPMGEHEALESSEKAMRELGWTPEHHWLEERAKALAEKAGS